MRRVHADRGVGGTRSARDHADARLARQFAVGFGHIGGPGFVATRDDLDLRMVDESVQHRQIALARHAKHAGHAVDRQRFNKAAGSGSGGLGFVLGHACL